MKINLHVFMKILYFLGTINSIYFIKMCVKVCSVQDNL